MFKERRWKSRFLVSEPEELRISEGGPEPEALPETQSPLPGSSSDFLISLPAALDRLKRGRFALFHPGGFWAGAYRGVVGLLPPALVFAVCYFLVSSNIFIVETLYPGFIKQWGYPFQLEAGWLSAFAALICLVALHYSLKLRNCEFGSFMNRRERILLKIQTVILIFSCMLFPGSWFYVIYFFTPILVVIWAVAIFNKQIFSRTFLLWVLGLAFLLGGSYLFAHEFYNLSLGILGLILVLMPLWTIVLAFWLNNYVGERLAWGLCSVMKLSKGGFSFGWLNKRSIYSTEVPWSAVKRLSVKELELKDKYAASADHTACLQLGIEIDTAQVANYRDFLAQVHFFAGSWRTENGFLTSLPADRLEITLPMAALSLESERPVLLRKLSELVPRQAQSPEFQQVVAGELGVASFTQLWLDEANLQSRRHNLAELSQGMTLQDGKYVIDGKIAAGGQATVYKAEEKDLAGEETVQTVAIKEFVLPEGGGMRTRSRSFESIKHEATLLASLEHPAIARLLDNFIEDNRAYLCFEFIEGRSLRNIVQEDGPMSPQQVLALALKCAEILSYLHKQSPPVVHRDLSPDNLMLAADGRLVLIDFNVAEQLESSDTKTVVGKHHYMAPEQFKGKPCVQSDLYSMGGCLFYLLTGKDPRPLSCSSVTAALSESGSAPSQDLILSGLDKAIAGLTELSLEKRYQSADLFIDEISNFCRHASP